MHIETATRKGRRAGKAGVAAAAALATALGVAALPATGAAAATATCTAYVATTGSDGNPGTAAAPWRSLGRAVGLVAAGSTICLPSNATYEGQGESIIGATHGTAAAPITVRSAPGGRARFVGQVWWQPQAHDVTFTDLDLVGTGLKADGTPVDPKGTYLNIDGDRISIVGNDIMNPYGICIDVGAINAYSTVWDGDSSDDIVISNNRIHQCGTSKLITFGASDSGSHGVYIIDTVNAQITDNAIYDNQWRGLQTWPKAAKTLIARNVFDNNATHVNIGSALRDGYPWYSSDTVVRDNIFTNRTSYRPDQNQSEVQGNFPEGSPTYGNTVNGNCFGGPVATQMLGDGFSRGTNVSANPSYRNRAAADFTLLSSSACLGKGPSWIQPAATGGGMPDVTVSVIAPTSALVGDEIAYDVTVRNTGTAVASAVSVGMAAPASTKLLLGSASTGSCAGIVTMTCALGDIAAGGTTTVRVRAGVIAAGTRTATVSAATTSAESTTTNNTATATTTATGTACTIVGTAGNDSIDGTAGDDVFCLFGGDDIAMPMAGDDVVLGGPGVDSVSYWNASAAVVVNLGQQAAWDATAATAIGWDQFSGVEAAYGSLFADTLVGSPAADTLRGLAGNDAIYGYGGSDSLFGGDGNDTINGGAGTDVCRQDAGIGSLTGCEA